MTDGVAKHCSVCSSEFQVRFSYQMEEAQSNGTTLFRFYCSQTCLDRSHRGEAEDGAICDHCATSFIPEFAAQVFFVDGKRRYACSQDCRRHLKKEQLSLSEASAGHISHQAPPLLNNFTMQQAQLLQRRTSSH